MAQQENNGRNIIIKNVIVNWPKLNPAKPVDNYAGDAQQWEITALIDDKRRSEFEQFGKVKEITEGKKKFVQRGFQKKAFKADGSPAKPVEVVDVYKNPVDPKTIGNGTKANIMLYVRDYEIKHPKTGKVTKSGTTAMLVKMQVVDLVEYVPKNDNYTDFDYEENENSGKAGEEPGDAEF